MTQASIEELCSIVKDTPVSVIKEVVDYYGSIIPGKVGRVIATYINLNPSSSVYVQFETADGYKTAKSIRLSNIAVELDVLYDYLYNWYMSHRNIVAQTLTQKLQEVDRVKGELSKIDNDIVTCISKMTDAGIDVTKYWSKGE